MWLRLFAVAALLVAQASVVIAEENERPTSAPYTLDKLTQEIKRDALDLNRDLILLSEEELIPTSSQVVIFVSMQSRVRITTKPVQVKLSLDGAVVADHVYTVKEQEALFKGGLHRLYFGSLLPGGHKLIAQLEGNPASSATLGFDKAWQQKLIEVIMNADTTPELTIRDWQDR